MYIIPKKNRVRHVANSTAWRKRNQHRRPWYHIKGRYGLTRAQYEAILQHQGGVCLICRRPPKDDKLFNVEHCHETGEIRGLVHGGCNIALRGMFDDDPEKMRSAANRYAMQRLWLRHFLGGRTCAS